MILRQFQVGPLQNFTYVVAAGEGEEAFVIDPSFEIDPVLAFIDTAHLKVRYVLNTHSHPDHVAGNEDVKARTGAKIAAYRSAPLSQDLSFDHGSELSVAGTSVKVLHTPGHTPDSVLYVFSGNVATGDTLFVGECGRTDLPGGSPAELYDSLFGTLLKLDDALVVLPGHDYGRTPTSTIGYERMSNYVLQPCTKEEFVRFMRS